MKTLNASIVIIFLLGISPSESSAQWKQSPGPFGVLCFYNSGEKTYAGCQGGVFVTNTDGASWDTLGLPSSQVYSIVTFNANIYAGTYDGKNGIHLMRSTDNGKHWNPADSGLPPVPAMTLFVAGTNIYAGLDVGGLFVSTNEGVSWNVVQTGLNDYSVTASVISGGTIFAATDSNFSADGNHLIRSSDNGNTWVKVKWPSSYDILSLAVLDTFVVAGTSGGVYRSTNNGNNWKLSDSGMSIDNVNALAVSGKNLFAGTSSHGVYLSKDNGSSWSAVDSGFFHKPADPGGPGILPPQVQSLGISGTNLLAGIKNGWTLQCPLSEIITSAADPSRILPALYSVSQNYPNPFNPSTTISFVLPVNCFVTLTIYDITGKEITTLVNGELSAGYHTLQWNAQNISSGIYFYRLVMGRFSETKKLVLLR
jgi:photosystem II stability/assembly factor-like uncharacterized protein